MQAYLAIQCCDSKGELGTFLFTKDATGARVAVSPVFPSLADLCPWLRANGWREGAIDRAHPVGVYEKSTESGGPEIPPPSLVSYETLPDGSAPVRLSFQVKVF